MLSFLGTAPFGSLLGGYAARGLGEPAAVMLCAAAALILMVPVLMVSPGLRHHRLEAAFEEIQQEA